MEGLISVDNPKGVGDIIPGISKGITDLANGIRTAVTGIGVQKQYETKIRLPGGGELQPENALTVSMNDYKDAAAERAARADVDPSAYLDNEIPQYYPVALREVFGAIAKYILPLTFEAVCREVTAGRGVMICLKSPGHFLGVVAYDEVRKLLVYRDSWPERTGTNGFNLTMAAEKRN